MGHLVNPISFRLYSVRLWDSIWFFAGKNYYLVFQEDLYIFRYVLNLFTQRHYLFVGFFYSHCVVKRFSYFLWIKVYLFDAFHLERLMSLRETCHLFRRNRKITKRFGRRAFYGKKNFGEMRNVFFSYFLVKKKVKGNFFSTGVEEHGEKEDFFINNRDRFNRFKVSKLKNPFFFECSRKLSYMEPRVRSTAHSRSFFGYSFHGTLVLSKSLSKFIKFVFYTKRLLLFSIPSRVKRLYRFFFFYLNLNKLPLSQKDSIYNEVFIPIYKLIKFPKYFWYKNRFGGSFRFRKFFFKKYSTMGFRRFSKFDGFMKGLLIFEFNFIKFFMKRFYVRVFFLSIKKEVAGALYRFYRKIGHCGNYEIRISFYELCSPTAAVLGRYIARRLFIRYRINQIMRSLIYNMLQFESNFLGFLALCTGRISRKQRAIYYWFRSKEGNIPFGNVKTNIDFSKEAVILKFGVCGIKVWLFLETKGQTRLLC